jgi:phospholipid/cholesterol/gamma-HCH transport system substrate-binding protein
MSRKLPELLAGFIVIVIAVAFLVYALLTTGEVSPGGYMLLARFGNIGALTVGSDVKIGGVIIGHVAAETLDPVTYAAIVRLNVNNGVKIPDDSSASITSDGLLGNVYVAVSPGGSNTMLASGAAFPVTQSAINVQDLIGKFIFSLGGSNKSSGGAASTGANGENGAGSTTAAPQAAP